MPNKYTFHPERLLDIQSIRHEIKTLEDQIEVYEKAVLTHEEQLMSPKPQIYTNPSYPHYIRSHSALFNKLQVIPNGEYTYRLLQDVDADGDTYWYIPKGEYIRNTTLDYDELRITFADSLQLYRHPALDRFREEPNYAEMEIIGYGVTLIRTTATIELKVNKLWITCKMVRITSDETRTTEIKSWVTLGENV